jgi:hypothetical protein
VPPLSGRFFKLTKKVKKMKIEFDTEDLNVTDASAIICRILDKFRGENVDNDMSIRSCSGMNSEKKDYLLFHTYPMYKEKNEN